MIGRSISLFFCIALLGGLGISKAQLTDPRLELQLVVSGLTLPTSLVFVGPDDFLVSQKNDGRVRRVTGGTLQGGEVLDLNVNFRNEQGLLSMVRDPDFAHNGYIYLYYTESSTGADSNADTTQLGNRVYRYSWSAGALVQPELILDLPADTPFAGITPGPHNGGAMAFGPDDELYSFLVSSLVQVERLFGKEHRLIGIAQVAVCVLEGGELVRAGLHQEVPGPVRSAGVVVDQAEPFQCTMVP